MSVGEETETVNKAVFYCLVLLSRLKCWYSQGHSWGWNESYFLPQSDQVCAGEMSGISVTPPPHKNNTRMTRFHENPVCSVTTTFSMSVPKTEQRGAVILLAAAVFHFLSCAP